METGDPVLWAARAVSLFDTIIFLWLGLAVLLNAERRVPGTWVAGAGLLLGSAFFALHSVILGGELSPSTVQAVLRSRLPWILFVVPPFLWYLVISWYAGTLAGGAHRFGVAAMGVCGLAALALAVYSPPIADYEATVRGSLMRSQAAPGEAALVMGYAVYSAICFALGLAALRKPGFSSRFMGDLGRRRAVPWMVAASLALLAVSLIVAAAAVWFLDGWNAGWFDPYSAGGLSRLLPVDLAVSGLLALVLVLLGRAVVSYEIFTGKVLPRGGFLRQWRNSLILAAVSGALLSAALSLRVEPAYQATAAALLLALVYALLGWRSHLEREKDIGRLRPFVASQRLYERIVAPSGPLDADLVVPLRALGEDVLGASSVHLVPLGSTLPLVGRAASHPAEPGLRPGQLAQLAGMGWKPGDLASSLDPSRFAGAVWAVPLWSERGLVGALLLGEKRDGSLYVQEEIEIARVTGERLIDSLAGAAVAHRLMQLQRGELARTGVMDRRGRGVLHDDVLPRLHSAILSLSGAAGNEGLAAVRQELVEIHRWISDLLRETAPRMVPEVARLGPLGALRSLLEGEMGGSFSRVTWEVEPAAEAAAANLPPLAAEVLYGAAREALRNAARHGRGDLADRPLGVRVSARLSGILWVEVEDDGQGFRAGETPGEAGGHGLTLHGAMMAVAGGALSVESGPGAGTRIVLTLPVERTDQPLS